MKFKILGIDKDVIRDEWNSVMELKGLTAEEEEKQYLMFEITKDIRFLLGLHISERDFRRIIDREIKKSEEWLEKLRAIEEKVSTYEGV